jgi:DMSO/TMAO reductase YedYZ molybdopterin-dependent catalytic subunit
MDDRSTRPSRAASATAAIAAAAVAVGLMGWARAAYEVRTLQERIMEWALLFVPTNLFEQGLQRFGANAKVIAVQVTMTVIALVLAGLGYWSVRRGARVVLATAALLWLFAMVVVMPVTGAGFFATGLFRDVALTNASYALLALVYASVLLGARMTATRPAAGSAAAAALSRRAFLGAVGGSGVAAALTLWLGRTHGVGASDLPVASVADLQPTATPPTATPPPTGPPPVGAGAPTTPSPASPAATPTPRPVVPPPPKPMAKHIDRTDVGSTTGAGRKPSQLASFITSNEDWYITTKNAIADPVVDPNKWRLVVDGEVNKPVQLDLALIYQLPPVELTKTLECISNRVTRCGEAPFGCDLISTAKFKGVRLRDLLQLAGGLKPNAKTLVFNCVDEFTSALPATPDVIEKGVVVYEMNGQVLPIEHGYPVRLLVPNLYGMKNPKWIQNIRPIAGDFVDWYGQRGWTREGVVRTMARIDTPAEGQHLPPGEHTIAGIAYAGSRGISKVEYSTDGGKTWTVATPVEPYVGPDTWLRWQGTFVFEGTRPADLTVRCVDGTGTPQPEQITPVEPNGQAGLDYISVYPA